ncbi:hypothetical protein AMTRI_Chr10g232910 [Amborella trichopoda]
MSDNHQAYRVETTPRLAQWRIENISACTYRKSDPFKIGHWNWYLTVERNRQLYIKLFPEISKLSKEQAPIASFVVRVLSPGTSRRTLVYPEISDKQLKSSEDFVWPVETTFTGRIIIDVEFFDLKIASSNGGEPSSIWSFGNTLQNRCNSKALSCLSRMLSEDLHTDVTINASNGSTGAHRAVLAGRSPVFQGMFAHNLLERESSTVNITDMSIEACQAFLNYIYGNIQPEEFLAHRLALLRAADKYDIADLKEACQESLLEDIDSKNVLERLQEASLYHLPQLKSSCMRYLVNFGKIFDIRDDFNAFMLIADRELIADVFQEVLNAWKGF